MQYLFVGVFCYFCNVVSATVSCSETVLLVLQYHVAEKFFWCCSILLNVSNVSDAVYCGRTVL